MTNEEAIETIKMAISQVEWEYPLDYAAAFDMAIEALKKQSNFDGKFWNNYFRESFFEFPVEAWMPLPYEKENE